MSLFRSDIPFDVPLGSSFPPGLAGMNPGHLAIARPLAFTILVKPSPRCGLLRITMVTLVRLPIHRHLLAGMTWSDSRRTRFSSRFTD